ncbi:hypothetical protein NCS56_00901300 [Fusarium sp. Ph1]|nr:hypothetical protein NCS56_00901300 [Fusarium sp. Ph1]
MPDVIEQMIRQVWRTPRGTKLGPNGRKNPDNFHYYRKWGFTIYRTYYGKESEEHWQALLHALRHQTKLAFGAFEDDEDTDQDDRRQVRELQSKITPNRSRLGLKVMRLWAIHTTSP